MRWKAWYEPGPMEVEIEVTMEELRAAIMLEFDSPCCLRDLIQQCACVLRAAPDELIAQLDPKHRDIIAAFLTEQAARFSPKKSE